MLKQVAEGVLVHESEFVESNAVVVQGVNGVLLIDPGISRDELDCLANDLSELGQRVVAGFSTHPHWDHMIWHPRFGDVARYATAVGAATARSKLSGGVQTVAKAVGIPENVPLELLGEITGLPADAEKIPWDGPAIRIIEHRAHTPGHAALLVEDFGVLVAGDMLSDVFIPMLDLRDADDPIGDYLAALALFEGVAGDVRVVVPGHGSVGGTGELQKRIDLDRAYVEALRDGRDSDDPRIGPSAKPGWEWVADVHAGQVQRLAERTAGG